MITGLTMQTATVAGTALALSLIFTPVVRAVARRYGAVAMPKSDRWHKKPTAMMGGIAIYLATIIALVVTAPHTFQSWIVIAASSGLFLVGLIDDFLQVKPYQKLIGQLVGAAAVIYFGLVLPWTASAPLNMMITFIWLIGITNAVNMLDNMDGLAAGVSAIAAIFLAINFAINGQITEVISLGAFAGALLGFLVFNHHPASIFMGDCGSMFTGFFLASTALMSGQGGGGRSRSVVAVLAVPVLVLLVPIFDTTFVTLMRKLAGRAASKGGRDHTSHRLVALGLSEKHAVWMLYAFAVTAGATAVLARQASIDVSLGVIAALTIVLTLLGVYLGRVRVYDEAELAAAKEKPLVAFLVDLTYKRRIFEVLLDMGLIALSYYFSYALVFGPARATSTDWDLFLKTVPVVLIVKLATFLASGVYRGIWRYASLGDAFAFVRSVVLSSVVTVIVLVFAFRFEGFSRTVFVIDGMLLLAFVITSRFAFRAMRRLIPAPHARTGKRVIIYGAGDGGELLFRELHNNSAPGYVPVAFVDDDAGKAGKLIHGLRVYHLAATTVPALCRKLGAEEILLSTAKISHERLTGMIGECAASGIGVTRASMAFQPLSPAEFGWVISTDTPLMAPVQFVTAAEEASLLKPTSRAKPIDH